MVSARIYLEGGGDSKDGKCDVARDSESCSRSVE